MTHRRVVLVGGGARSGKSRYALARATDLGRRRLFVATAEPLDDEMGARISRHRAERGDAFLTLEEPVALAETIARVRDQDVVLVDCLTLWISNLLVRGLGVSDVDARVSELVDVLRASPVHVVLVTNEVGMGLVPETALGRAFRDATGFAHQRLAGIAEEIYLAAMGVILRLRPAPVDVVTA